MLAAVQEHVPGLLPYARLFLGWRSAYRYLGSNGAGGLLYADQGGVDQGVDQGDPLALAFPAVTIREPLERLEARLRDLAEEEGFSPEAAADAVRVRAYLDDVLVRMPASLAARVPDEAAAAPQAVGGSLDHAKTRAWRSAGGCPTGCEKWWQPAGLPLLGGPLADKGELTAGATLLGSDGYVGAFLAEAPGLPRGGGGGRGRRGAALASNPERLPPPQGVRVGPPYSPFAAPPASGDRRFHQGGRRGGAGFFHSTGAAGRADRAAGGAGAARTRQRRLRAPEPLQDPGGSLGRLLARHSPTGAGVLPGRLGQRGGAHAGKLRLGPRRLGPGASRRHRRPGGGRSFPRRRRGGLPAFVLFSGLSILPQQISLADLIVRVCAALYLRLKSKSFRDWVERIENAHLLTWVLRSILIIIALRQISNAYIGYTVLGLGMIVSLTLRSAESQYTKEQ